MKIYKIKNKSMKCRGELGYENGQLKTLKMTLGRDLNAEERMNFKYSILFDENNIRYLKDFNFEFEEQVGKDQETKGKVACWCNSYRKHTNIPYRITKKEVAMLMGVKVTDELATAFLKSDAWWASPKSIDRYVKYFNEVQLLVAGGVQKSKYPDEYDQEFERKLKPEELAGYWEHLRSRGWVMERRGASKVWTKKRIE